MMPLESFVVVDDASLPRCQYADGIIPRVDFLCCHASAETPGIGESVHSQQYHIYTTTATTIATLSSFLNLGHCITVNIYLTIGQSFA